MEEQIQFCNLILEKINKIKAISHPETLDNELTNFLSVFQEIKRTTYQSFNEFKELIVKNTSKKFHFNHYNNLPFPILIILNIFLSELNLLYDFMLSPLLDITRTLLSFIFISLNPLLMTSHIMEPFIPLNFTNLSDVKLLVDILI